MADDGYDEYEEWQLVDTSYYSRRQLYALDWGGGGGGGGGFDLAFMRCGCCLQAEQRYGCFVDCLVP
jgi:hypothetical protein